MPAPPASTSRGSSMTRGVSSGRSSDPFEPTPVTKLMGNVSSGSGGIVPPHHKALTSVPGGVSHHHHHHHHGSGGTSTSHHHHHGTSASSSHHHSSSRGPVGATSSSTSSGMSLPSVGGSSSGVQSSSASSTQQQQQQQQEQMRRLKKEKETFLIFTRVLLKYLEQKDPVTHQKVKGIIKDCAERNKRHVPGYESVTTSMKTKLKQVVTEEHWQRAESYLKHFLQQKNKFNQSQHHSQQQQASSSSSQASSSAATMDPSKAAGSSISSSTAKADMDRQKREKMAQLHKQRQAAAAAAAAKNTGPVQSNPRSISGMRKDIAARTQALQQTKGGSSASSQQQQTPLQQQSMVPSSASASASSKQQRGGSVGSSSAVVPSVPSASPSTSSKGKASSTSKARDNRKQAAATTTSQGSSSGIQQALQRKASSSLVAKDTTGGLASSKASAPVAPIPPAVVKEYSEYMNLVDHAMNLEDWTSSSLILGQQAAATLAQEQKQLLYSDNRSKPFAPLDESNSKAFFPRPGWSRRNVFSTRSAWAKVRLRERAYAKQQGGNLPVVAGGLLTIPPLPSSSNKTLPERTMPVTSWFNEDVAEEDKTLAIISEATQIYLKEVLQKAVHCARQRENLDGIRLWHQQVTHRPSSGGKKPPLSLRLGCNVSRQLAQAQGNAAMTVKRMEQALENQSDLPIQSRTLNESTLMELNSLQDASLRPRLRKAVEDADYQAKRSFEVFGGKDEASGEPPFGRVPKKAKLQMVDFQVGMNLPVNSSFRNRHRATATGAFFSF